ncbi:1,2-phenylacetyl-CoA epoxidase subunit PaaD [Paenarthrobacter aurescens]|nr:1,2-phenylacetyl-CoA epoxidase subunit PaaD [Paenarthrobacter aurescens]MDO6144599.1 phenylacetate-CoA oxygenase subunit PaaJ [Paenarthrobacter aurescens]MDO6148444.1 phenylacetate-CoA oxygenase subunit PaaJ [Paenarthrobacter aurescens]MDO6159690.1 phenylacetate-CoA oxygenase subunit PaaJ [Paenarthrobacter aurescens]MDO6164592.1 phenylacetate-CoA oxygenase subunit PaaJ [Paenarthrobacter aurescens]
MTTLPRTASVTQLEPEEQRAWDIASTVCDPEIPVLTIEDLGILRGVRVFPTQAAGQHDGGASSTAVEVTITPTYSGCPAMDAIGDDLRTAFVKEGYASVHVNLVLSPAWTTDWMTESGKAKLEEYGIAPPSGMAAAGGHSGPVRLSLAVKCPQCNSLNTKELTRFGSTSCKALFVCQDCKEPFDYFKVL